MNHWIILLGNQNEKGTQGPMIQGKFVEKTVGSADWWYPPKTFFLDPLYTCFIYLQSISDDVLQLGVSGI